jgi:hypothetical protein
VRVLLIGDVVGSPGRRALTALLPALRVELGIDVIVANGENAAAGRGLTQKTAKEMFRAGVDIISSGNHIWDQREIVEELDSESPILRPANYPPGSPGKGIVRHKGLTMVNLQGRTFMANIDDPFRTADALLEQLPEGPIIVDMHAEATSERWRWVGTWTACGSRRWSHTHVPTADPAFAQRDGLHHGRHDGAVTASASRSRPAPALPHGYRRACWLKRRTGRQAQQRLVDIDEVSNRRASRGWTASTESRANGNRGLNHNENSEN